MQAADRRERAGTFISLKLRLWQLFHLDRKIGPTLRQDPSCYALLHNAFEWLWLRNHFDLVEEGPGVIEVFLSLFVDDELPTRPSWLSSSSERYAEGPAIAPGRWRCWAWRPVSLLRLR